MTKKRTLPSNKVFVGVWVAFHALILAGFCIGFAIRGGAPIDSDLFNMLPDSTLNSAMRAADDRLTESTGQNIFVLVSHDDFARARDTAVTVYEALKDNPKFSSMSLYADSSTVSEIQDFVHRWRYNVLDKAAVEELSTEEGAQLFADNAVAKIYGAFTLTSLDSVEEDPFLLDENNISNYLAVIQDSGTAMSPKDGVLATEFGGKWYVMIRGALSKEGSALASRTNGIATIYDVCTPLETDGIRFVYSGTPFHSYESSTSASHEITLISSITLSLLIVALLVVFQSWLPVAVTVGSILMSILTAFCATQMLFGDIHILTLVFGTSLIGSCVDYSLHYFINWKANTYLHSGTEIRHHLLRGLLLSLLSTEICYVMLVFAPFNLLKQMSVFSIVGIFSSFLTVCCLYPLLRLPAEAKRRVPVLTYFKVSVLARKKYVGAVLTVCLFAIGGVALFVFRSHVGLKNDINKLYTMEGRLKEDTVLAYQVLQYSPSAWFIVSGDSPQAVLEKEEALCARLEEVNRGLPGGGYLATTRFVPSIATQRRSLAACRSLVPLAAAQLDLLGFDEESAAAFAADFAGHEETFVTPDSPLPEYLSAFVSMLWLGEIDGTYYSVVLPNTITDEDAYIAIAGEDGSIYFENKMEDLSHGLDRLTRIIAIMFIVAFVAIFVVLKFFYSWKQTLKIASVPVLSVIFITAVFASLGEYVEFFCITGMILVFGLGVDYIIYMMENAKGDADYSSVEKKMEPFAILLSFLTTAVSFGALALSTFVPVHTLGLTIFVGLLTAFVCTLF